MKNVSTNNLDAIETLVELLKRLWDKQTRVRTSASLGLLLELAGVGLGVLGPFALKALIDGLDEGTANSVIVMGFACLFVVSWAGASLISTWRMVFSGRVIDRLNQALALAVMKAQLPVSASARTGDSGRTLGHIERLPYSLTVVLDGLIWHVGPLILQIAGSLWLLSVNIPSTYSLILLIILIIYALAAWWGAVAHQRLAIQANIAASQVSHSAGDLLRNARRVVFNGALNSEIVHLTQVFGQQATSKARMMWSLLRVSSVQYALLGAGLFTLLALGVSDTLSRHMSVGDFVLLQAYAFRLAAPLGGVGFILSQSSAALVNIREIFGLMSKGDETAGDVPRPKGPVALSTRDLDFRYGPDGAGLSDIGFDLMPGSFNVIVGPNGSGKSTLAQILAGILEPAAGTVSIDGQDLHKISPQDRHAYVLYVPQFIGLFNRSLEANALYPPTTQTAAKLTKLLKQWKFHDDGREIQLTGMVGEQGERLSGGQIQKLELARIAGIKAPVIILDESTSALDPKSEEKILWDLRRQFQGKITLIVITHHRQLAEGADRVLFLKRGKLIGFGRHIDLMHDCPEYADLWRQ